MERALAVVVFAALALCALVTKPYAASWNDRSRLATIDALVTHHTFAIEDSPFAAGTQDKYRYRGHVYSDKPPALALQGALAAEALEPLGVTLARAPSRAIYAITLLTVGAWFALGCAYAYAFARALGFEVGASAFAAALTGLGTLALPYASVLANHVPAGAAAIAALYHLFRSRSLGDVRQAFAGGAFVGLACAFDAPAIVFGLSAIVLLWGAPRRCWVACALACAPLFAAQIAFNAGVSTGLGPPAMNQTSWADPASPFYRGANASEFLFSSPLDFARYAVYLLVGDKGLIAYTPLVLVCGFGLARLRRGSPPAHRLAASIVLACGAYFALMVAFTNDYGALNYGERRYADLFFVLGVGLAPALAVLQTGLRALAARLAVAWSVGAAMLGVVAPFGEPPGVSGAAFAAQEFGRLMHRAPVQAALDALALGVTILLVLRFWSSAGAPTSDSGRLAA